MAEVDSSNQLDNNSSSLNDSPQSSNGIVADNSNGKNGDSNQGKKIIGKSKWEKKSTNNKKKHMHTMWIISFDIYLISMWNKEKFFCSQF